MKRLLVLSAIFFSSCDVQVEHRANSASREKSTVTFEDPKKLFMSDTQDAEFCGTIGRCANKVVGDECETIVSSVGRCVRDEIISGCLCTDKAQEPEIPNVPENPPSELPADPDTCGGGSVAGCSGQPHNSQSCTLNDGKSGYCKPDILDDSKCECSKTPEFCFVNDDELPSVTCQYRTGKVTSASYTAEVRGYNCTYYCEADLMATNTQYNCPENCFAILDESAKCPATRSTGRRQTNADSEVSCRQAAKDGCAAIDFEGQLNHPGSCYKNP